MNSELKRSSNIDTLFGVINEVEKSSCGTSLNGINSDSYRTRAT